MTWERIFSLVQSIYSDTIRIRSRFIDYGYPIIELKHGSDATAGCEFDRCTVSVELPLYSHGASRKNTSESEKT